MILRPANIVLAQYEIARTALTRVALARKGRNLKFDKSAIVASHSDPTFSQIAETFEAIIGAIHEDSGFDRSVAEAVMRKLGFDERLFSALPKQYLRGQQETSSVSNVPYLSATQRPSSPLQSLPSSKCDAKTKVSVLSGPQAENLTLENPPVFTKKDEPSQQEQIGPTGESSFRNEPARSGAKGGLVNSSSTFKVEDAHQRQRIPDPKLLGAKEKARWDMARHMCASGPFDLTPENIFRFYETVVAKEERKRRFDEVYRLAEIRKEKNIRLAQKLFERRQARKREITLAIEAKERKLQKPAQQMKPEVQIEPVPPTEEDTKAKVSQKTDLAHSPPKQKAKLVEKRKVLDPEVDQQSSKDMQAKIKTSGKVDEKISLPKEETPSPIRVIEDSATADAASAEKHSLALIAHPSVKTNSQPVEERTSVEPQNVSVSTITNVVATEKKSSGLTAQAKVKTSNQPAEKAVSVEGRADAAAARKVSLGLTAESNINSKNPPAEEAASVEPQAVSVSTTANVIYKPPQKKTPKPTLPRPPISPGKRQQSKLPIKTGAKKASDRLEKYIEEACTATWDPGEITEPVYQKKANKKPSRVPPRQAKDSESKVENFSENVVEPKNEEPDAGKTSERLTQDGYDIWTRDRKPSRKSSPQEKISPSEKSSPQEKSSPPEKSSPIESKQAELESASPQSQPPASKIHLGLMKSETSGSESAQAR